MTSHVMVGVLLLHIVLLPVLYLTIVNIYKQNAEEQFVGHVREISGLLVDVFVANDDDRDDEQAVLLMESVLLGGEVVYIDLVGPGSNRLSPIESAVFDPEDFVEDNQIGDHGDGVYFISLPLEVGLSGLTYNRLRLGFDEAVIVERLTLVKQRSLLILTVYFLCVIVVLSYLTSVIMRPLKALGIWSKNVARGETSKDIKINSYISEVSNLSNDLESMRVSLVELAERMQHRAMHDELTGLPNRSLNNDRIDQAISRAGRGSSSFAVMLLDLDRFKDINDTLGHGIGDQVLMIVAGRLESGIRESDTIARIGGDEFCAIIEGAERVVAEKLAMKLTKLLEPPFQVNGHTLQVGASIGIAVYPDNGNTPELLLQRADVAMYEAKYQSLKVVSYHEDMDKHRIEDLQLSNDMYEGIRSNQFYAVFQPKIDLVTGRPCGIELLTRWKHPRIGLISPKKFIPIAERENMIGEMTRTVFDRYAADLKRLVDDHPGFQVSINVSPLNLLDTSLLDDLNAIMMEQDFDASSLMIEVTENAIMTNPLRSASVLRKFASTGMGVSVDDFGTGYSSLAYLQKFPITELKIDKSFIIDLHKDSQNYPIVNATITMAHDLAMTVIAEGVETRQVANLLEELKCDLIQGDYYSKPLSFTELVEWLSSFEMPE